MVFLMIIAKIIPLIGFIGLGVLFRKKEFLSRSTVDQLKWLIVNVLLPGVLFKTFLTARLEGGLVIVALAVFAANLIMMGGGFLVSPLLPTGKRYAPFLTGGMEYGMLGLALFSSLYGVAGLEYIAVVDLGHEIFFWFLLIPIFTAREEGKKGLPLKSFLFSPINIGIIAGLVLNLLGITGPFGETAAGRGVFALCDMMGAAIGPLILMVIGYGLRFVRRGSRDAVITVLVRLPLAVVLAYCVGVLLIRNVLGWSQGYVTAIWILFLTAPSFSIPIFARSAGTEEESYITSTIAIYTIITFIAATVVLTQYPVLY